MSDLFLCYYTNRIFDSVIQFVFLFGAFTFLYATGLEIGRCCFEGVLEANSVIQCILVLLCIGVAIDKYGRKKILSLLISINLIFNFMKMFNGYDSEFLRLLMVNLNVTGIVITGFIVAEVVDPKILNSLLNFVFAIVFAGVTSSQIFRNTFIYSALNNILYVIALCVFLCMPESPYWLASRGLFDECLESINWFNRDFEEFRNILQPKNEKNEKKCTKYDALKYTTFTISVIIFIELQGKGLYSILIEYIESASLFDSVLFNLNTFCLLNIMLSSILVYQYRRRDLIVYGSIFVIVITWLLSVLLYFRDYVENIIIVSVVILIASIVILTVIPNLVSLLFSVFPFEYRSLGIAVICVTSLSVFYALEIIIPKIAFICGLHTMLMINELVLSLLFALIFIELIIDGSGPKIENDNSSFDEKSQELKHGQYVSVPI